MRGFSGEPRDLLDRIDIENANDRIIVVIIPASDFGFESSGCGVWHRIVFD